MIAEHLNGVKHSGATLERPPSINGDNGEGGAGAPPSINVDNGEGGAGAPPSINGDNGQAGAGAPPSINGANGQAGAEGLRRLSALAGRRCHREWRARGGAYES
jgi:hypothetical protein